VKLGAVQHIGLLPTCSHGCAPRGSIIVSSRRGSRARDLAHFGDQPCSTLLGFTHRSRMTTGESWNGVRFRGVHRLKGDIDAQLAEVRNARAELERQTFEAWSAERRVRAVVNGQGELTDLEIVAGTFDGPHPTAVGGQIVDAVAAAKADAAEAHRARFHHILPGIFPGEAESR
jgi:DNA-binding protein YbaB